MIGEVLIIAGIGLIYVAIYEIFKGDETNGNQ